MRFRDCFEVQGLQLENGAAVLTGSYDPRNPPTSNDKLLMIDASEGSIFIKVSGELYQKKQGRWVRLDTLNGVRTSISSNDSLLIETGNQYNVYTDTFTLDGDLEIEGTGEFIVHE